MFPCPKVTIFLGLLLPGSIAGRDSTIELRNFTKNARTYLPRIYFWIPPWLIIFSEKRDISIGMYCTPQEEWITDSMAPSTRYSSFNSNRPWLIRKKFPLFRLLRLHDALFIRQHKIQLIIGRNTWACAACAVWYRLDKTSISSSFKSLSPQKTFNVVNKSCYSNIYLFVYIFYLNFSRSCKDIVILLRSKTLLRRLSYTSPLAPQ